MIWHDDCILLELKKFNSLICCKNFDQSDQLTQLMLVSHISYWSGFQIIWSPAGDWQTGCLWWEVVELRFHVDLKSNFALKNNSMEFWVGPITRRINVLYESRMKWTWHHSKLAVEEVSFFGGLKSGTPSTIIYTRQSSGRYELGCDAPMILPYRVT